MVDQKRLSGVISHFVTLFEEIISKSEIKGDVDRAKYGLKEAREIQNLFDNNPYVSNSQLKQIHSKLTNMTRGVEYFDQYEMEKRRRELGNEIYFVKKDIEKKIKW